MSLNHSSPPKDPPPRPGPSLVESRDRAASTGPDGPSMRCVVLAASAGGIPALLQILAHLPTGFPAALAIVLHRSPGAPSVLAHILDRKSRLPVREALPGEPVRTGMVYLAPADFHMVINADRTVSFVDGRRIRHVRSSANPLFESAASVFGPNLIAVVLTGGGSDATDGVQTVTRHGGVVIAQDPETAKHIGMPESAIRTGTVRFVLPLAEIGPALVRLTQPEDLSTSD